jgi:hypothetical protein
MSPWRVTGGRAPSLAAPRAVRRVAGAAAALVLVAATLAASKPTQSWTPHYRHLVNSDDFGGSQPSNQWAVYDTRFAAPSERLARVPGLVQVSGGLLHVLSTGDAGSGLCLCLAGAKPTVPYGRWDVRLRMKPDGGHGFAVLLWPNAEDWPQGGEIDLAELPRRDASQVEMTVHYGDQNEHDVFIFPGDFSRWHTFSVEWRPDGILYAIDGRLLAIVTERSHIPIRPMHLALQAGPSSPQAPPTTGALEVDWVRYYR